MKQIYSKPELIIVLVHTQKMIAESLTMGGNKGDYSGNQLSREGGNRNSIWDDDEE